MLRQDATLESLNREISALRTGFGELTNLSAELSRSNESLKAYSEQVAERMQERDEDLAAAYGTIGEQERKLLKKDNTILKMGIAIGVLGLAIIAAIAVAVLKLYGKLNFPWLKL